MKINSVILKKIHVMHNRFFSIETQNSNSLIKVKLATKTLQSQPLYGKMPPGKFFMLFCRLLIFFKINFFEKFFQQYHQSVKQIRLDPDQAKHFVGPDLGPICLQWLSADNTSRQ